MEKEAEWDDRELFRMTDDLFFYILFHRNIPVSSADVVAVAVVVVVVIVVVIIVVVVVKTVPGVFPFFFKLMVFTIIIPDITRTKKIQ